MISEAALGLTGRLCLQIPVRLTPRTCLLSYSDLCLHPLSIGTRVGLLTKNPVSSASRALVSDSLSTASRALVSNPLALSTGPRVPTHYRLSTRSRPVINNPLPAGRRELTRYPLSTAPETSVSYLLSTRTRVGLPTSIPLSAGPRVGLLVSHLLPPGPRLPGGTASNLLPTWCSTAGNRLYSTASDSVNMNTSEDIDTEVKKECSHGPVDTDQNVAQQIPGAETEKTSKATVMPKHLRYKEKCQGKLPVPSIIELQVVGNGVAGAPRSITTHMNYFRYLFNCGEGTQRICIENRMKIARLSDIFITHRSWDNIGGLLGMVLSLDAVNIPLIRIHGPPGVEKLVTMARGFAQFVGTAVEKHEISEGSYEDSAMTINYIPLYPNSPVPGCLDDGEPEAKRKKVCKEEDVSVVYICVPHEKPAAISLEKCVDLGVPWGPHIGRLKNGEEITLENGTVVKPEDVLSPQEASDPFIVVECPDESYLDSLESSVQLQAYQTCLPAAASTATAAGVALLIHLTPPHIMELPRYRQWMSSFGDRTRHLLLNGTGSRVSLEGVYRIQAKLNLLHPEIFPLLPYQQDFPSDTQIDEKGKTSIGENAAENTAPPVCEEGERKNAREPVVGETGLAYYIRGPTEKQGQFCREKCIVLDQDRYIKEAYKEGVGLEEALRLTRESLQKAPVTSNSEYPEIVFLGTGSAVPNKVRNVSSVLLHLSDKKCMLLDCGEDTYGQLLRHYGDRGDEVLGKLVAVFISHLHADHHLGLLRLALARRRVCGSREEACAPLRVYASEPLQTWLDNVSQHVLPLAPDLLTVTPLEKLTPRTRMEHLQEYELALDAMDLFEFVPVRVRHRQYPHGIVLTHRDGWKLCYSGDTMPCRQLVKAGQGSDILIHEATMEDMLEADAVTKKHCTTSQAINVGVEMEAKFILLTHFSQRYAKVPIFNDQFTSRVGIAFDNMRVCASDLPQLPHFMPALKVLFAEQYAEMEEKREKRRIAEERKKLARAAKAPSGDRSDQLVPSRSGQGEESSGGGSDLLIQSRSGQSEESSLGQRELPDSSIPSAPS